MATPNENLAKSLESLKSALDENSRVIKSSALSRTHRERLMSQGFLKEIMAGWLMVADPGERRGESAGWYASYWDFLSRYLADRFGENYHLSPESTLQVLVGTSIPQQLMVHVGQPVNQFVKLPSQSSLLVVTRKRLATPQKDPRGVQIMSIEDALCEITEAYFTSNPLDAELALKMVREPSGILHRLLQDGKSVVAGRLAGAYRFIGKPEFAESILTTMRGLGYDVRESNPFRVDTPMLMNSWVTSPYAERIKGLWNAWRDRVAAALPAPQPGVSREEILHRIDDIYTHDAYNSLSIEGYRVTPELINKVRNGEWDPKNNSSDAQQRDALAARGYWLAFTQVKEAIGSILDGEDQASVIVGCRHAWFMNLFTPSVQAGIIQPQHLAGFRSHPVMLRGSLHAPPHRDYLADCMDALDECFRNESDPGVRAVLGHFFFVFIHPYTDGNGRTARFMMNATLASSGYPWTVIREESRDEYFAALERASVGGQIDDFADFVANEVKNSMTLKRKAAP